MLRTIHPWVCTLKFKIVLLAMLTGLLSAAGTAWLVVRSAQGSIERVVLAAAEEDRERSASLLGSKVSVLRESLAAAARHAPPELWRDPAAMGRYLLDKPALGFLFSSISGVATDGRMLARVEAGVLSRELPNVADRAYFKKAMASDQPVISDYIVDRIMKVPVVVFAVPVLDRDGRPLGLLAGSLALRSTVLFDEIRMTAHAESSRDLVIDRSGRVLAHRDPARLTQAASDEPGLQGPVASWLASGGPIDVEGDATVADGHVVSMAGIPLTDWLNVRVTPAAQAFAPVDDARSAAWPAAAMAGVLAGLLAGVVGYAITRPISHLKSVAESLLSRDDVTPAWPDAEGEVGALAKAFRHVVEQKHARQLEVQALLQQIQAVLDHADVGIALTRNGRFELVSHQFCQIFAGEKGDLVGRSTRVIYSSDESFTALADRARPALTDRGEFDTEHRLARLTGQVFWSRMRGRAIMAGDVSQGTIWTIEDVTAVREAREQLTYSASHDALTGLLNRAAFERLLDDAAARAASEPFAALFIDLDRFKLVNDTGGHAAGDALLRQVAQTLAQQVRRSDVLARMGGDEFAVLLTACPPQKAMSIAGALCAAVEDVELDWEGQRHQVGASVGLVHVGAGFAGATDVLRAADAACYDAKRHGRGRVEVFKPSSLPDLACA